MRTAPRYNDGHFKLYKCMHDTSTDYPEEYLHDMDMAICYREVSVYDRLRNDLYASGKEVTLKVRIPAYRKIDSNYYVSIDDVIHHVYNAAHVISKEGFPETELTLITPEHKVPLEGDL